MKLVYRILNFWEQLVSFFVSTKILVNADRQMGICNRILSKSDGASTVSTRFPETVSSIFTKPVFGNDCNELTYPTDLSTILEYQNLPIDSSELHKFTVVEDLKL